MQATTIVTNIRAGRGKKHRQFSWIESWTDDVDETRQLSRGMSLTLAEWFQEGILMDGGLLAIDPAYFAITGGRERWLYRVARKHAGGAGAEGFAISFTTLFQKSGAEGTFRRFKFELLRIARENALPDFGLCIENEGAADPLLRMIRRDQAGLVKPPLPPPRRAKPIDAQLSEEIIARIRKNFPGWDVYALQVEFDAWLADRAAARPENYQAAFYGFVRRYHEKHAA